MKKTTLFGNSVIFNSAYYVADEKGKRRTQNFTFQAEAQEYADWMSGKDGVKYTVVKAA